MPMRVVVHAEAGYPYEWKMQLKVMTFSHLILNRRSKRLSWMPTSCCTVAIRVFSSECAAATCDQVTSSAMSVWRIAAQASRRIAACSMSIVALQERSHYRILLGQFACELRTKLVDVPIKRQHLLAFCKLGWCRHSRAEIGFSNLLLH